MVEYVEPALVGRDQNFLIGGTRVDVVERNGARNDFPERAGSEQAQGRARGVIIKDPDIAPLLGAGSLSADEALLRSTRRSFAGWGSR